MGTHWITLYVNAENVTYFDSFGVENIPKEIRKFIGNKDITMNIYRIKAYDSIMCWYFCTGFIDFLLNSKKLFSPNDYEKNDKIIKNLFLWKDIKKVRMRKIYCTKFKKKMQNLKSLKDHIKHYFFIIFVTSVEVMINKYLGKKNQLNNWKFLV